VGIPSSQATNPVPTCFVSALMDSSLINGALYWPEHKALELCLASGRRYLYLGVPPEVAEGFASARSKGSYFNRAIRGRFDCHPLRDQKPTPRAVND
jgi:hypothetical protein